MRSARRHGTLGNSLGYVRVGGQIVSLVEPRQPAFGPAMGIVMLPAGAHGALSDGLGHIRVGHQIVLFMEAWQSAFRAATGIVMLPA